MLNDTEALLILTYEQKKKHQENSSIYSVIFMGVFFLSERACAEYRRFCYKNFRDCFYVCSRMNLN